MRDLQFGRMKSLIQSLRDFHGRAQAESDKRHECYRHLFLN
jgi:hypothetical protein